LAAKSAEPLLKPFAGGSAQSIEQRCSGISCCLLLFFPPCVVAVHQSRGIGRDTRRGTLDLSFHCLRHTAVSLLRDAQVPEAAVMELVGHDSVEISRRYTHVGREALSKAVDALPTL